MTTHALTLATGTGRTLYAYPNSQSLAQWTTNRVLLVEANAPNLGRYAFTLDDALGFEWKIFEGATQPTTWDAWVFDVDLRDATAATQATAAVVELGKVPRASTAIPAGGDFAWNAVSDTANKLTINVTNEEA